MSKYYFFLLLFISFSAQSQNIRFEGTVQDTLKKPLEMANVMAINQETKALDGYGITNDKGKFQLNLKTNSTYKIKISYIGFQSLELDIQTKEENIQRTVVLKEGGIQLEGVEIVQEMPVSIKGDTLIYNADSFKTGTEQKLEDILKKLPGVEVNADGEIEVEGRKVTQLLVEGKKFFEGDTKLGSKNIPSDAVDKVQVLRNFNEVSQMRGLENNEENIALNIKLKKGKNKFWFGDITAGVGPDERYLINPKIFYYSPKTSINVLSNLNNIGDVPFSNRDFFRLTGGARNTINRSGTNIGISTNDLGISTARNNRAASLDTKFGALNLAQEISKKWNVSGFGILSSNKTFTNTTSNFGIFQPNSTEILTEETRNDISALRNNLIITKIGSKFKPNSNFQLDYDASLRRSSQTEDNILTTESVSFANGDPIVQNNNIISFKRQDPVVFNQSLNAFWTQSEKHTWVLEMQHNYQDEDPFFNPDLEQNTFPDLGFVGGQNRFNINQDRFVKTNKVDAKVDYYFSATPRQIWNLTFGNTNSYQSYNSSIFQILDNGSIFNLPDDPANDRIFNNDVRYSFNDAYVGVHYKFILGKFTFNPGVNFHKFNTFNDQQFTRVRDDFYRILPDVFAQWDIKKSESMTYTYRMSNFFNDINSFVSGYTFNNFNTLNAGNRFLENALQESHSLRYRKYNLFNFTTIFGGLSYTRTTDPVVNRVYFEGINQISQRVNADFTNQSFNGFASYQRSFKKFYKASVFASLGWNKSNALRVNPNDQTNPNSDFVQTVESYNQNYRVSFGTQFRDWPNLEAGYNVNINQNPNTTFTTHSPSVQLSYFFLNGFSLTSDYTYNDFRNSSGTSQNTYEFLNASLNYRKKDAKFEYRVSVTNLLNTKTLNDDSFGVTNFSSSQYIVQPRYLIFSLKYNL